MRTVSNVARRPREDEPELSVVVLSYRNDETVLAAVDSLLAQEEPLEIILSHSGGGETAGRLARERPAVRVLASDRRRLPGEARNAGMAEASGRYIAFLEGDCVAAPGWAARRLARHRAGAVAVAGAVAALEPGAPALAAHLIRHSLRMPHVRAPDPFERFTVSYTRELLDRYGPFPERVARGEDTAVNAKIVAAGIEIVWAPDVVLRHLYPRSALVLLHEEYERGRIWGALAGRWPWRVAGAIQALASVPPAIARGAARGSPFSWSDVASTVPLVVAGTLARACGRIVGGTPPASADLRSVNVPRRARLAHLAPWRARG